MQQIDRRLVLDDTFQMSVRVCMVFILATKNPPLDLAPFLFFASHIFTSSGHHITVDVDLICLIKRLEEIYTE